jgi:hypothetical protein
VRKEIVVPNFAKNVTNETDQPLSIAGVVIPPKKTARVDRWRPGMENSGSIRLLINAGAISIGDAVEDKKAELPKGSAGGLPGVTNQSSGLPGVTDPNAGGGGLPGVNQAASGGLPGVSEDAEKDKLIAALAKFGINRTRRASLTALQKSLDQAKENAKKK